MIDSDKLKLSILIPVYNEAKYVANLLEDLFSLDMNVEVIAINDGSSDGTLDTLNKFCSRGLKVISHKKNFGKGEAIKTGLKEASGDIILIQDADLEYNPKDYQKLLAPFLDRDASVVYGMRLSRRHLQKYPIHYLGNKLVTLLMSLLYGVSLRDVCTGYKVFKTEVLKKFELNARHFDFDIEITSKLLRHRYKIYEIPIYYKRRNHNDGKKFGWRDRFVTIYSVFRYRFFD